MYTYSYIHTHTHTFILLPPNRLKLAYMHMVLYTFHLTVWFRVQGRLQGAALQKSSEGTFPSPKTVLPELPDHHDHRELSLSLNIYYDDFQTQRIKRIIQWTVLKKHDLVIIFYQFTTNFLYLYFEVVLCSSVWM